MTKTETRDLLGRHGWNVGGLGVATFENGDVTLDFDLDPTDGDEAGIWGLQIGDAEGACQLWIHYGERPEPVLRALFQIQGELTTDNFRDKLRGLLAVAEKIEVQLDEDSVPVPLVDE
jgi:hypothetical protein